MLVKRKLIKKMALLVFSQLILFMLIPITAMATSDTTSPGLKLEAKSAVLMEVSTGQILYEDRADVPYPPASMSKMMSEYIVLDSIQKGRLQWDDIVTASENAETTEGSKIFLAEGDTHTVKQLFIAMAVGSANDATVALAEHIAGTEEEFAKRMNQKAEELQLDTAHFINATGLDRKDMNEKFRPMSIEGETVMSAKDSAMLALNMLRDYPDILEFSSIPSYKFRERDEKPMVNYDWMLEANQSIPAFRNYAYEGLDGLKTGYTTEAGYCFTGTAERNGMRLISVVMGTEAEPKRFIETRKLLDYGFNNFELKDILSANSVIDELKSVTVKNGVETEVPVVTENGISLVMRKGGDDNSLTIKAKAIDDSKLVAPLKKGSLVGTATVTYKDGNNLEEIRTLNMISAEEVEKASWYRLLFRAIAHFFVGLLESIKSIF